MVGLDHIIITFIGQYLPYIQGSIISIGVVFAILKKLSKLTKTKWDDVIIAKAEAIKDDILSGKSVEDIIEEETK